MAAPIWAMNQIIRAEKSKLDAYRQGVAIENLGVGTIDDLRSQACADRIRLAAEMLVVGDKMMTTRPASHRSAISRYYYSMYHACRAVVYYSFGGDDYEAHSKLPTQLPGDFPAHSSWQNALKDARLYRNDADYDPYPDAVTLARNARAMKTQATDLLAAARAYLRAKGCTV